MDVESLLLSAPWLAVLIWVAAYSADYFLTIAGASLYVKGGKSHVAFEGSYELNPAYVADVDRLKWLSPTYLIAIPIYGLLVGVLCYAPQVLPELRNPALFGLGAILSLNLSMLPRHASSIAQRLRLNVNQGAEGSITFSRWLALESAAVQMWGLASLLLIAAFIAWKAMLFGAAVGISLGGLSFFRLSRLYRLNPEAARAREQRRGQARPKGLGRALLIVALIYAAILLSIWLLVVLSR